MSNNVKRLFFVTTLVLLLFAIAAVSASDVSDDAALPGDSSVSVSAADSLVNDNNIVTDTVTRENNNKQEKTNIKKATLDTPKTVVVTSTNYSDVFTNTGLCSDVNDGDVIDVQSDITTNNFNITIDKAINLTTTTGAIINLNTTGGNLFGTNPGNSFKIVNSGSYTNVTNLKFYNTQVFVINAHHVTMDNINVTVNNQVVGSGVGVTSIRDNSTYVTVKNSNFYTKNNGGSSSVVLAWADYCTIDNNNITGEGNVGNLMYLTTYNINGTPEYAVDINMYNNITNNNITAVSVTGPCVGVVVTGHDNKFENNKVNVSSSFAGQWMSPTMNEQGDHDDRWEGNSYINNKVYGSFTGTKNSTITGNTFHSSVSLPERCIFKNNNAENSTVTVTGPNCYLCNNTIYKLVVNNAATNTTVCEDNIIDIISGAGNIVIVSHPTTQSNSNTPYSSILNKKYTQPIKSEGEPTIIDITAENIEEYFLKDEEAYFINRRAITSDCIIRLNSLPDTKGLLINNFAINKYNVTVVGSENLELNNLYLSFSYVDLTKNLIINYDENFEYNETLTGGVPLIMSAETDNITINYKPDMVEMKSITLGQTLKNSIINAEVPSVSNGYTLLNSEKSLQLINNNITIEEKYPYGENPSIIGILLQADTNTLTGNNITMNGESTLTAIKLDGNSNTITNNNITVTTPGTATGVEINGNDNTVTDNRISANEKTGNDAVTVTGENNVVENNTASEDTRKATSIELTYNNATINVGQRLVVRGVFKADGVESGAEGIKVYDNDELIATINTSDEYGTISYGYTPVNGGTHVVTFEFAGNDTHKDTSTSINVKVNGSEPIIIITADNFYDYFNSEGELNYTKLSNNTTVYFESVPDEIGGITFTEQRNAVRNMNLTFVGLDGFTLTNKYVVIESALKNFNLYNMTLVYTQEYMGSHLVISPKNEQVEHYTVENVVVDLNYTDWNKENSIIPIEARGNNIVFENITMTGVVPADFINWDNGIRASIPIYVNGNNNLLSDIHVDLQVVSLAEEFSSLYPSIAIVGYHNTLTGSDIKINGSQYNYGISLNGEYLTVSNNTFNITAERYSSAVVILSRSSHITIEDNNINCSTTYYADGEVDKTSLNVGYCIYLEGRSYMGGKYLAGSGGINDTLIKNNYVVGSAFNIYGIEGYGNDNVTVVNNTFNLTAYYPMGITIIGTCNNITDNVVVVNGESNDTGGSPDYIDPTTAGIILQYGENSTVYNNSISAINGSGILLRGDDRDNITSNNVITSDFSYTIVLDGSSNNATVEDNYLETPGRLGDESVKDSGKDNVVQNNLPVVDKEYFLKVDTTEFVPGSTATISASIYYGTEYTSDVAQNISKGKVSFKVNGKTLKDANGKVIYAKVVNGTATIEDYQIPDNWNNETTIQAVYSGSSDVAKMSSEKTAITVIAQEPTITTEDVTTTVGGTITLTATINTDAVVNTGKVVFKINGKSLKDANGKVIYTKVSNNQVSLEYTLPESMNAGTYTLTAVFISSDYDRLEDTKTLTVN